MLPRVHMQTNITMHAIVQYKPTATFHTNSQYFINKIYIEIYIWSIEIKRQKKRLLFDLLFSYRIIFLSQKKYISQIEFAYV